MSSDNRQLFLGTHCCIYKGGHSIVIKNRQCENNAFLSSKSLRLSNQEIPKLLKLITFGPVARYLQALFRVGLQCYTCIVRSRHCSFLCKGMFLGFLWSVNVVHHHRTDRTRKLAQAFKVNE